MPSKANGYGLERQNDRKRIPMRPQTPGGMWGGPHFNPLDEGEGPPSPPASERVRPRISLRTPSADPLGTYGNPAPMTPEVQARLDSATKYPRR